MNPISPDKGYAHPEKVVSTEWLAANLDNPSIRIIESNEDPLLYPSGHIPGAFEVDWALDLNDQETRDYLDREGFKSLMQKLGIENDTHLIFYGDKSNWWACYALWVFELFGHTNSSILDGGRQKWEDEGRPMAKERPVASPSFYAAPDRDDESARAYRDAVLSHVKEGGQTVDVRSPGEFTGERLHRENYPNEGALRGGISLARKTSHGHEPWTQPMEHSFRWTLSSLCTKTRPVFAPINPL
ncbi:MAG: rhodanese-like domain-containing protein [Fimbriimonadaceae bacterium]